MKRIDRFIPLLLILAAGNVYAWDVQGYVACDTQPNGYLDALDEPLSGVGVIADLYPSGVLEGSTITDGNGYYFVRLRDDPDTFQVYLDSATLTADAVVALPAGGSEVFTTTYSVPRAEVHFLVDSAVCRGPPQDGCWMTGGGVKFEPLVGDDLAAHGPRDTLGGVVYPSCDGEPSEGGQWNRVAHSVKEHYQAFDVSRVSCGNVDDHPPGSESPVTPFNYIEREGEGRMKGIRGNKSDYPVVHFFGRAEDRNEPGSEGPADGGNIDSYFLHAWITGPGGTQTTVFNVDEDGDCSTVNPRTISGGNLQLHYSSCD